MVLRVGPLFMIAVSRELTLPPQLHLTECVSLAPTLAAAQDLVDCELSLGRITEAGWVIDRSSLPWRENTSVTLSIADESLVLATSGGDKRRWAIVNIEGAPDLP